MTREQRDRLLTAALGHTEALKPKARDVALFDFLCGALWHEHIATGATGPRPDCPPWLWIMGLRHGNRVKEAERMLAAPAAEAAAEDDTPDHIIDAINADLLTKA